MWTPRFGSTGDIFSVGLEACRLLQYFCHLSEGDTWTGGELWVKWWFSCRRGDFVWGVRESWLQEWHVEGFLERCGGGLDGKKGSKDKESKKRKEQRKGRAQGREAEQALLEKTKTKTKKQTCHPSITFHSAISFSDSFRSYCGKVCPMCLSQFRDSYPSTHCLLHPKHLRYPKPEFLKTITKHIKKKFNLFSIF